MEGLRIAACFSSFISLLLLIIALASDYWGVASDGSGSAGLWRGCSENNCMPLGMGVAAYIHATRAFLLIGAVAGAVSFFGLGASFSHIHVGSISISRLAMVASFVAGVCSLVAMSIFTGVFNDITLFIGGAQYGWSFGIGWVSVPLFLLTGLTISARESTEDRMRREIYQWTGNL